jgi:hypothetical protein
LGLFIIKFKCYFILKANKDKIDWNNLSENQSAISLLEANKDNINWIYLSLNPNAQRLREMNIHKMFGPTAFERIVCLDTGAHKDDALEELGADLVEDFFNVVLHRQHVST